MNIISVLHIAQHCENCSGNLNYAVKRLTKTTDSVSLENGKPFGMEMGSEFTSSPRERDPVRLAEEEPSSRNSRGERE